MPGTAAHVPANRDQCYTSKAKQILISTYWKPHNHTGHPQPVPAESGPDGSLLPELCHVSATPRAPHVDLEGMENVLKHKDNARGLAADVAFQLSAGTRRKELTEKDALAGLDADLKEGG